MSFIQGFIFSTLLISSLLGQNLAWAATVTVNGSQQNQTIDGFGVNVNTAWWNGGEVTPALDMLTDQLGAKLFRAVIEESDWEAVNDDANPNTFNWTYYNQVFSSARFQGVWSTLRYLNNKGIRDGLVISLMGKAPDWMGPNQTINTSMEDELVETVAALLYYARNTEGIQFTLVSPFNEADTGGVEGPSMGVTQYARVYRKLALKLDSIGMSDVRFSGPDAAFSNDYFSPLVSDSVIVAKMAHWAFHTYNSGDAGGNVSMIRNSAYPSMKMWVTETATFSNLLGQVATGSNANLIWDGFDSVYLHAIRAGRGDTPPNDSPGIEQPLIAYNSTNHTYTPRKGFYENAQLMKFVLPGAVRIGSSDNSSSLVTVAFRNPDGQIVIVGQNSSSSAMAINGTLTNLATSVSSLQLYQTNASMNLLRGSDIAVAANGTFNTSVAAKAYFTLIGGGGPALPSISITANPSTVTVGESSTLTWNTSNATSCEASGAWSGSQALSGSLALSNLQSSGTYTLTCTGPGGSANQSAQITVNPVMPAPQVNLSANPTSVSAGSSSTLTWSSSNASSCTASGAWSGSKATSGSQVLSNLSASGTYTLTCSGNGSASASATITVTPVSGTYTVLTSQTPAIGDETDNRSYELGMKFQSSQAGTISAIRYYRAPSEPSVTHTGRIWSSTGTLLASVVFSSESASGWQQASLATPLAINANTTYVVSVNVSSRYVATSNGFQSAISNGPLTGLAGPSNGVFGNSGAFPTSSWNSSNYFRDVVFVPGAAPQMYSVTPSGSNVTISPSGVQSIASGARASFTVTANSGYTRSSSVGGTCPAGTWSGSVYTTGAISANCTVSFSATQTPPPNYSVTPSGSNVTFSPSGVQSVVSGSSVSFTVTANSGYTRSTSVGGTCPAGSWSGSVYTTGAISANCTVVFSASAAAGSYSVFTTQTPAIANVTDGVSYELGMKFQSSQAGSITAIRYYKARSESAGGHTGRIWSSSGTLLATVTFSSETASGWQTATLSSPLAVAAGTIYVVTVNTKSYYAATNYGLQNAVTNGPLTAVAGPANGVYGNSGTFPTMSWNSSNYFRDVVFVPSP